MVFREAWIGDCRCWWLGVCEKIAFLTGRPLLIGALSLPPPKPERPPKTCTCCGEPLLFVRKIEAPWEHARERKRARARPPPLPHHQPV